MRKPMTIASGLAVALAACGPGGASLESRAVPEASVSLGGATAALFLSPQTYTVPDGGGTGYVVLVEPDGTWRAVEHHVMDQGGLIWTDDGLVFADSRFDYRLGDTFEKTPSPKTNLQDGLYVLDDGTAVAILNEGFEGSPSQGYTSQVVVTADGAAELHRVEGWHSSNASCDGEVLGIGPQSGRYFEETRGDDSQVSLADPTLQPQMLTRLYPLLDGHEEVLAYRPAFDFGENQRDLPCEERTVTFLSSYADRDGERRAALVHWNVDSGEFVEHELTGGAFDTDDIALARYDSGSLVGDRLEWLHRDGHLMSTDVGTGATERRFDTGARSVGAEYSVACFTENAIVTATVEGGSGPIVVAAFDRDTGAESWRLELDDLADRLDVDMVLRSVAVRPGS
jgi:hypothetical protein